MISVDMTPFGITVVCSTAVCYGDTPLVLLYIAQKLGAIFAWAAMTSLFLQCINIAIHACLD